MASVEERMGPDGKPRYVARYRSPDGASRSKSFLRKRQATEFLTVIEYDKLRGSYIDPSAGRLTVCQYGQEWAASQGYRRPETAKKVANSLKCLYAGLGDMALGQVRRHHLEAWRQWLSERYAPNTVRAVWGWARTLFLAAVADRLIAYSPFDGLKLRLPVGAPITPPTAAELEAIADALPARWGALVLVGARTGLRPSELLGLCKEQFSLLARPPTLTVDRQLQAGRVVPWTKTANSYGRRLPLDAGTTEVIAAQLAAYPPAGEGRLFSVNNPRRTWACAVYRAGIDRQVRMHDLRHFYASELLAATRDFKLVADRLGDTVATTMRVYVHLVPLAEDRGTGAMDRAFVARSAY
jgi:integrase